MNEMPVPTILGSVITLLTEAYAGPPDPSSTWFIDNEPDSGVFGLLNTVSAEEASTSVDGSGAQGTTIASHAEHLRWSLTMMNSAIRGEPLRPWKESWLVLNAGEAEWDRLRQEMRSEYETLKRLLSSQTDLSEEYLTGVLALLPHAAYHLGVIRQMIERVRE